MNWLKWFVMPSILLITLSVMSAIFLLTATPAVADDDEDNDSVIDDTYVAPTDYSGSDEQIREEAGSGFDTTGPIYIDEDDYYSDPNIPEPSPPVPVDEEE
ncbi:MAG: hypothetical protein ACUVWP_07880 [bacterium]